MRIVAEDSVIEINDYESQSNELFDFLNKHKKQEIHVLLKAPNGVADDEKIIHENIDVLKEFSDCSITFEYEPSLGYTNNSYIFMKEYRESHVDGKRNDGNQVFSINHILEDEKFILKIANEINSSDFSQVEKAFAVYNLTTSLKKYNKEVGGGGQKSRSLFEYLNNNYMVCSGYVNLMDNLCYLTGVPSYKEAVVLKNGGKHARLYVNICDEKYGINGYYIMDPTKDKNTGKEFGARRYQHFLTNRKNANINIQKSDLHILEDILTYRRIDGIKSNFSDWDKIVLKNIFTNMDKEFAQKLQTLDLSNDDDIMVISKYLREKMGNEVEEEKIHDIIFNFASKFFKGSKEDIEGFISTIPKRKKEHTKEISLREFLQQRREQNNISNFEQTNNEKKLKSNSIINDIGKLDNSEKNEKHLEEGKENEI